MQDLSHLVPGLVPSSMEGGNMVTTQALQTLANPGAKGSPPVTPMPSPELLSGAENLPAPKLGPQMPVNPMSGRVHSTVTTDPSRPPDTPAHFTGVTVGAGTDKPGSPWRTGPFS